MTTTQTNITCNTTTHALHNTLNQLIKRYQTNKTKQTYIQFKNKYKNEKNNKI